ncbi:hypothetical protein [Oricola sp.]|uniref:hypothetical protein n=1 Tax=Oricola sp. TaxID=1979950 RepID=UPI003BA8E870
MMSFFNALLGRPSIGGVYMSDISKRVRNIGLALSCMTMLPLCAMAQDASGPRIDPKQIADILLEDEIWQSAEHGEAELDIIERMQDIARGVAERQEADIVLDVEEHGAKKLYEYVLDGGTQGLTIITEPDGSDAVINVFDKGGMNQPSFEVAVPVHVPPEPPEVPAFNDEDDLFLPPESADEGKGDTAGGEQAFDDEDDLFAPQDTPQTAGKKQDDALAFERDTDTDISILDEDDLTKNLGQLEGFWKVSNGEVWHITVSDDKAGQVLRARGDVHDRMDELRDLKTRLTRSSRVYVWQKIDNPEEKTRHGRIKGLDPEVWEYVGEEMDVAAQESIKRIDEELDTLETLLTKQPEMRALTPGGYQLLRAEGANKVNIWVADSGCDYEINDAFFDGHTLGAKTDLHQRCMFNDALPDTIKGQLQSGGYPTDVLAMMTASLDPRTELLRLSGRDWTRYVHHDMAGTKINRVTGLTEKGGISAFRMTPIPPTDEELCEEGYCEGNSCAYNTELLSSLYTKERIYEQYLEALHAEEKAVSQQAQTYLGNSKVSAARLESARIAARITHTLDEVNGALVELFGLGSLVLDPSGLRDPLTAWEALKDVNSLVNRLENAWTDLDKQVEALRYVHPGEGTTDQDKIFNQKDEDNILGAFELKGIEDKIIELQNSPIKALPEAFRKTKVKVPGTDSQVSLQDAIDLYETEWKNNTSNIADLRSLHDLAKSTSDVRKLNQLRQLYATWARKALQEGNREAARKLIEASREASKKVKEIDLKGQQSGTALAVAQIGMRLASTYVTQPALEKMRKRVLQLRRELSPAVDTALDYLENVRVIRIEIKEYEEKLAQTRQSIDALSICMSKNCAGHLTAVQADPVAKVEKRPDGALSYNRIKTRLAAQLQALEEADQRAAALEETREKICPVDKELLADKLKKQRQVDGPNEAECDVCNDYAWHANRLENQIEHLFHQIARNSRGLDRIETLEAEIKQNGAKMQALNDRHQATVDKYKPLFDALGYDLKKQVQDALKRNHVMSEQLSELLLSPLNYIPGSQLLSSPLSPVKDELNQFEKTRDARQVELTQIHNEILKTKALNQSLRDELKLLKARQRRVDTARTEMTSLEKILADVLAGKEDCEKQLCKAS